MTNFLIEAGWTQEDLYPLDYFGGAIRGAREKFRETLVQGVVEILGAVVRVAAAMRDAVRLHPPGLMRRLCRPRVHFQISRRSSAKQRRRPATRARDCAAPAVVA